jgi:uncharacterized OsmC-like protein
MGNNVNITEIESFVSAIREDPSKAKKQKRVAGTWVFDECQPQFVSTLEFATGAVTVASELPPFAGGWGTSPDPVQYCLYGLAACFAVTLMATAASEGVDLVALKVTASNRMNLRKQMGLSDEDIVEHVAFAVDAEGIPRGELERIVALAQQRCPGVECLTRSLPLSVEIKT